MVSIAIQRASVLLALCVWLVTGLACEPKRAQKSAPAASGSAVAAGAECAEYAKKVCAKAGDESPTCSSFKDATNLMSPAACSAGLKDLSLTLTKLASARSECDKLVQTLCAAVGSGTKTCQMVTTQTASFSTERCKEMAKHVPEVTEELKRMEAANQPLSKELQAAIAANNAPSFGPDSSPVKVVEFSDFECPFCSRAAGVVHQLKEKYGTSVRFVFRQFPLPMHSHAHVAAQAALAASAQGKFWEFHDLLFQNQQALDRASLEEHARKAGLNLGQFKRALDGESFKSQVDQDVQLGSQAFVQGTPTMFVNGARVENPTDFGAVASMIDQALGSVPPG